MPTMQNDDPHSAMQAVAPDGAVAATGTPGQSGEIDQIRRDYENRLLLANLRTEAVKAGMIDLDGLRLIDLSSVRTHDDGTIADGTALMAGLRRRKPWLFGTMSSSSHAAPPLQQPPRQKTAMDMSDEEYASARAALTKYSF
jgi:hypothetical protein